MDFTRSMANATRYADLERDLGIPATYFIQTKYVKDWNDDIFFNTDSVPAIRQLIAEGMEVASHTVAHTYAFKDFPMGTGRERYPDYTPFLLEAFTDQPVVSFRPGHLSYPFSLPQALVATGYRFSSSITANTVHTHLPFQTMYNREYQSEVNVFEFPVTLQDEEDPPLGGRFAPSIDVAHSIGHYGGLVVVLIHTDVTGQKLEFERRFVESLKSRAWFGTMRDFGLWREARSEVSVDVVSYGRSSRIILHVLKPMQGLTLELSPCLAIPDRVQREVGARQEGNRLVFSHAAGLIEVSALHRCEVP